MLQKENVKINFGPRLNEVADVKGQFPLVKNFNHEHSDLELAIELVDDVDDAINHINTHGSNHTESIVTKNSAICF